MTKLNNKNVIQLAMQIMSLATVWHFIESQSIAGEVAQILGSYEVQAKKENPKFAGFSAAHGDTFFHAKFGPEKKSCTTCHTSDAKAVGRTRANKDIQPMAPAVNAERLTDQAKVEKWFVRNCQDVLARNCSAQEKGDFVAYLVSIQP